MRLKALPLLLAAAGLSGCALLPPARTAAQTEASGKEMPPPAQPDLRPSLDGRYVVRLHRGQENPGNHPFDRAELFEAATNRLLFSFDDQGGGFGADSVSWAPDSRHVAVGSLTHRAGYIQVVRLDASGASEQAFPEFNLPHENERKYQGRPAQRWLTPRKWRGPDNLEIDDSGVVQQQRGNDAELLYGYTVTVQFGATGPGSVMSVKRYEFKLDDNWIK